MKPTRRDFLKLGSAFALMSPQLNKGIGQTEGTTGTIVNDIHSQLNQTVVERIISPASTDQLRSTLLAAKARGKQLSICGRRHSMGGQQFGAGTVLLDLTAMNSVLSLDRDKGLVEVEAGIEWPELLAFLAEAQRDQQTNWGIVQKQTGADRLSIGGALASNVHGRGLKFKLT